MDRHPVEELVKIADAASDKKLKADIWMALQGYVEAPQKEAPKPESDIPTESLEAADAMMKHLADLSKPLNANTNP